VTDFVLRRCGHQDLEQVYKMEKASFPDDAYSKAVFFFYFVTEGDGFVVACKGDLVVGYVIATHHGGNGLIQSIAVSPEFRKRGIGEMLMRSVLAYLAPRFGRVYLQVDAKHEATIRFYRRLSFSETGKVLKRYYPNGDDALEMVRKLDG
jgi:[ribosomal protein S18]-alanine N-acetyltransferase